MRFDCVLAPQLEGLSAEFAGAGTEQGDGKNSKLLTTKDTKEHGGEVVGIAEIEKAKPTTEARRHGEQPKTGKGKNLTTDEHG